jgi:Flp pilus assembly pilin Flp
MQKLLRKFWSEENGQDMVEYSLLLGFFALAGAGVLGGARNETISIWHSISSSMISAGS